MESIEYVYLKNLIKDSEAKFGFNKFFIRRTFGFFLIYKNNQTLLWLWAAFVFLTSEWFWIPFSIFLAWKLHAWWIIIIGIAFSWIVDEIIKGIIIAFLPDSFLRDEDLLNYLWGLKPFHITISSTKMITRREEFYKTMKKYKHDEREVSENLQEARFFGKKMPAVFIYPPNPWQTVVKEFKKEN